MRKILHSAEMPGALRGLDGVRLASRHGDVLVMWPSTPHHARPLLKTSRRMPVIASLWVQAVCGSGRAHHDRWGSRALRAQGEREGEGCRDVSGWLLRSGAAGA